MSMSVNSALVTDLYQLTMMQTYVEQDMLQPAVFEFFVRHHPRRNFLLAAGLESVLEYLENLQFTPEALEYLASTGFFSQNFLDYLATLRFTGDVHGMAEGTPCFANEPIIRITAPLPMAQLVESRIINLLHFQTLIASKAARVRLAAPSKQLMDFGLRRAHGAEAGLLAARAAYIAGLDASATVQAGQAYGVPVAGTMAHSFIQAHADELTAFRHFVHSHPHNTILLIDTYDVLAGAAKVVTIAKEVAAEGIHIKGVRIDSGDLAKHAQEVRALLDEAGFADIKILVSGSLDEHGIAELERVNAPIDGYGVGTRMDTAADSPYLDCAYKLQEYAGQPRRKRSEGKATWPGSKQVYRQFDSAGQLQADTLTPANASPATGEPLIQPFMENGQRLTTAPSAAAIRQQALANLHTLPPLLRQPEHVPTSHLLEISEALQALARQVDTQFS